MVITTAALNDGVVNIPYSQTLAASGANGSLTWSSKSGTLPAGLTLSSCRGNQRNATTATMGSGSSFVIQVQDSGPPQQAVIKTFTSALPPHSALLLLPALTDAILGVPYSATLQVTGGITPLAWSVTAGSLPVGLQLSSAGVISGTPTAAVTSASFTVKAQDSASPAQTATQTFTLHVAAQLRVATVALADGRVGSPYSQTLTASGGSGTFTWSLLSGSLPPGMVLHPPE